MWAIKNISRVYFGAAGDIAVSAVGTVFNPRQFCVDPVTGNVGIGNSNPSVGLEIGIDDSGRNVIFHANPCDLNGRLIWDADQAALRLGRTEPGHWNQETLGQCSLSVGAYTKALGEYSGAIGEQSVATGRSSIAGGYGASARGHRSVAMGNLAFALGNNSIALGLQVKANADNSIVVGKGSTSQLTNDIPDSLMVGFNTTTDPALFVNNYVGIGTTSPVRKLHVNDVMRLEPRSIAPANPGRGDLYYDSTDDKLKCYNGTSWRDCF